MRANVIKTLEQLSQVRMSEARQAKESRLNSLNKLLDEREEGGEKLILYSSGPRLVIGYRS